MTSDEPLPKLKSWIDEARADGLAQPGSVALCTVGEDGRPSARTITLKRFEPDALLFTTALWTRKAKEIEANSQVALLFHWPSHGRQVHLSGRAEWTDRELSEELFAEREPEHQRQTIVSRQGEPIESLDPLREQLAERSTEPISCPEDWGGFRIVPSAVEFWSESPDRLHKREIFERADEGWSVRLIAP